MKVVAILGGLGSQMMKFAFYLKLKEIFPEEEVYIDTTFFLQNQCWNGFELERIFNIREKDFIECYSASEKYEITEKKLFKKSYFEYTLQKMIDGHEGELFFYTNRGCKILYSAPSVIMRKTYNTVSKLHEKIYVVYNRCFNPQYEKYCAAEMGNYLDRYTKNCFVKNENIYYGEFNHVSDKYFSDMRKKLQEVFSFPGFNEVENKKFQNQMEKNNSVALHVRMTDHAYDNSALFKRHYYKKAVAYIKASVVEPVFYIFADDYKWCKENLEALGFEQKDHIEFITWNRNENSYKDMQLMTYCKHNILAISSFSWWGYYLSKYKKKIVCAPKGYWLEVKNHF